MSVFTSSKIAIRDFLGLTTRGQKTKANSIPVTLASDEDLLTRIGSLTEVMPSSDMASSGLNGRLQRIATNISALHDLLTPLPPLSHKISRGDVGVNNVAYASGDTLGSKLLVEDVFVRHLRKVIVFEVGGTSNKSPIDILIFDSDPSFSTATNNNEFLLGINDTPKLLGRIKVQSADYTDYGSDALIADIEADVQIIPANNHDIYLVLVAQGTPTYINNGLGLTLLFY